jgi:hypothetical protein
MPSRVVDLFAVDCWYYLECCCVEDGAFLPLVVFLEGK